MNLRNNEYISTDVLIIGGGLAGCFAAIKAAEQGVNITIVEKAGIERSGNAGTGLHRIPLIHPDYNWTYEEFARLNVKNASGLCDEDISYEFARGTLDRILDLERWGIKMRNDDGSFNLGPAEDLSPGKNIIWPPGPTSWHSIKPVLANKVKQYPNITVFNRTAAIGLLTRDGLIGSEVVGAVGMETRSGRFVIFKAKAVILTSGGGYRMVRHKDTLYAPNRFAILGCPTNVGEGQAMAYRAGADILNMEFLNLAPTWKDFFHWGIGGPVVLCRAIGGNGQTFKPPPGEEAIGFTAYKRTHLGGIDTEGPLYFDASGVRGYPEVKDDMQRLMWLLESEGTSYATLQRWKERGEDWTKAPVEMEWGTPVLHNAQSGIHMDVNARSTLDGLYCAGDIIAGGWRQSSAGAFVFGAIAGKSAAEHVKKASEPELHPEQIKAEKNRILQATDVNPREGYSWIELEDRVRTITTDYGPPFTNDGKLARGLFHLERIKTKYLPRLYARSPREMMRVSEVKAVFYNIEAHLRAALFRKESRYSSTSAILYKTDHPKQDDKNWLKHTLIRNVGGEMTLGTKEVKRLSGSK